MKVTGNNAKMFMGEVEIGKVESWKISGINPIPEDVVSFDGIYDPEGMDILKAMVADGRTEFVGFIHHPTTGEEREARFRIIVDADSQPSIEPIDDEIKELVKEWTI